MNQERDTSPTACRNCRYFREQAPGWGACHRYPPAFAGDDTPNERHRWKHPIVQHHNWCGEFVQA